MPHLREATFSVLLWHCLFCVASCMDVCQGTSCTPSSSKVLLQKSHSLDSGTASESSSLFSGSSTPEFTYFGAYHNMKDDVERRESIEQQLTFQEPPLNLTRIEPMKLSTWDDLLPASHYFLDEQGEKPLGPVATASCGRKRSKLRGFNETAWLQCVLKQSTDSLFGGEFAKHCNELGCTLEPNSDDKVTLAYASHKLAFIRFIEMLASSGADVGLLIEDDIGIPPKFLTQVQSVLRTAPPDWDVIKLGWWNIPGTWFDVLYPWTWLDHARCLAAEISHIIGWTAGLEQPRLIRYDPDSGCAKPGGMHALLIRGQSAETLTKKFRQRGISSCDMDLFDQHAPRIVMYCDSENLVTLAHKESTFAASKLLNTTA